MVTFDFRRWVAAWRNLWIQSQRRAKRGRRSLRFDPLEPRIVPHAGPVPPTLLASSTASGTPANADSFTPVLSSDGRYEVFASNGFDLAPAAPGAGPTEIFRKDLISGRVDRIANAAQTKNATSPAVSADGRFVAFVTSDPVYSVSHAAGPAEVVVADIDDGTFRVASTSATGIAGNGQSRAPALSADGRFITFASDASNLVINDSNGVADVFRKDLVTGRIVRVDTTATGAEVAAGAAAPTVSRDGRYVAFATTAALDPTDANGQADVYRKDLLTGRVQRASVAGAAGPFLGVAGNAGMSADGRYVLYSATAAGATHLFVKDMQSGAALARRCVRRGRGGQRHRRRGRHQRRRPVRHLRQRRGEPCARRYQRPGRHLPEGFGHRLDQPRRRQRRLRHPFPLLGRPIRRLRQRRHRPRCRGCQRPN